MKDHGKVEVDRREMESLREAAPPGSLEEYLDWCRGEGSYSDPPEIEEARRWNREQHPDGCELCGEPAGAEMGEFYDPRRDDGGDGYPGHVIAHAQCGIDAGLALA
jgi:hypothetical protein